MNNDDIIYTTSDCTTVTLTLDSITGSSIDTVWLDEFSAINTYTKPDDPVEVAQYKLSGLCPACKANINEHHWGCPEYNFNIDVSDITLSPTMAGAYSDWQIVDNNYTVSIDTDTTSIPTFNILSNYDWINVEDNDNT